MASILNFPGSLFAETPTVPARTTPSAEEAALNRPRRGLHLVNHLTRPTVAPEASHGSFKVVAQLDLELARRSTGTRLRRMFSTSDYSDTWPLGAA